METSTVQIAIADIHIRGRHRKEIGDVGDLCESIKAIGLLHPVVLDRHNRLVSGNRRIAAYKQLGLHKIPAYFAADFDNAVKYLIAERDENTCRKDFTISESVAMGLALEKLERPKAKERQQVHGGTAPGKSKDTSEKFTEVKGETRDKVGAAIGMSGVTYQRAKAVVEAAEKNPEKYSAAVAEMDRSGKVTPAYEKLGRSTRGSRNGRPKKLKPKLRFVEDDGKKLCNQLRDWLMLRSDKAGGLEAHDMCVKVLDKLQERIEQWQEQKSL